MDTAVRDTTWPQESPAAPDFSLVNLFKSLWRRRWLIVTIVVVVMAIAIAVISSLTPRFTATATVVLNPREMRFVDVDSVLSGLPQNDEAVQTEVGIMMSRELAERTVLALDLMALPEFNPFLRPPEGILEALRPRMPGSLVQWLVDQGLLEREHDTPLDERVSPERQLDVTVSILLSKLLAQPRPNSLLIDISAETESPTLSQRVVNTHADFYIVSQLEAKFEATERANRWLSERIADLRQRLAESERAVEQYRLEQGLILGGETTLASQAVQDANARLIEARATRIALEAQLNEVQSLTGSPQGLSAASEVLANELIQNLRQTETELLSRAAELSEQVGEQHPSLQAVRAQLRDLRETIGIEITKILAGLRSDVEVARARERALEQSLRQLEQDVTAVGTADVELRALLREVEADRALLETFLSRSRETANVEGFLEADATIVSHAVRPNNASYPNDALLMVVSFAGAVVAAVGLSLLLDVLDRGFRSMDQIQERFGVPALGLVPELGALRTFGRSPPTFLLEHPTSAFAEAIRNLYTGVMMSSDTDQPPRSVLIASSFTGEGKTTTAASLAFVAARAGKRVLLIDCDLRRPGVHRLVGGAQSPGLLDYFSGEATVDDIIAGHGPSGVHFIAAGRRQASPPDLLGSQLMRDLLKQVSQRYDLILFDVAPIVAVSDALALSQLVDRTVLLVRWVRTPRAMVQTAMNALRRANAKVAGVALTKVDVRRHATYDYGDSGYYVGKLNRYYTGS